MKRECVWEQKSNPVKLTNIQKVTLNEEICNS